jgi:hypothetical protein
VVRNTKDKLIVKNDFLVNLLIRQSLYENKELKSISLDLLHTLYSETSCLGQRLKNIQIIEDNSQLEALKESQQIASELFSLSEKRETWYSITETVELNQLKHLLRKIENMLSEGEKIIDDNITMEDMDDRVPQIITEHTFLRCHIERRFKAITHFTQDLTRNSQSITYICTILEHSMASDKKVQNHLRRQSLEYGIFQLLAELIHENQENKKIVKEKVGDLILQHLQNDGLSSNAIVILNHMVKNNPEIVSSVEETNKILNILFSKMVKEHRKPMKVAYDLYTAQQFTMLGDQSIRPNQNLIISDLISNNMSSISTYFRQDALISNLKRDLANPFVIFDYGTAKIKILKPELCMFMSYIEIITLCCFDKNPFAEKIGQSLITVRDLTEILSLEKRPILFEYELCKFIFHVFIDIEKEHFSAFEMNGPIIANEMKKTIESCLIAVEKEETLDGYYLTHKELVSEVDALYDLMGCSIQCFKRILNITKRSQSAESSQSNMKVTCKDLIELYQVYKDLFEKKPKVRELFEPLINQVNFWLSEHKSFTKNITIENEDQIAPNNEGVLTILGNALSKEREEKETRLEQLSTIFRKQTINDLETFANAISKAKGLSFLFQKEFHDFRESQIFEELASGELKEMIKQNNTSDKSRDQNLSKFFESLVVYLDPENKVSEDTVRIGLKIFREYASKVIDQAEHDQSSRARSALINTQDFLISIGTVQLICNLLLNQEDPEIIMVAIDVGSQILINGNSKGQAEFKKVLQTDKNSYKILKKLEKVMISRFENISRIMITYNAAQMKQIFFGEKSYSTMEMKVFNDNMNTFNKLLRFFQLLCEGHNSDLQNFLRVQHLPSVEVKLAENIDYITHAVIMFGSFVKFFNIQCYETGIGLIDFLIESLQGPCKGNQETVIKCKILDFCKDFINDLNSNNQDLISRGFDMQNREHIDITTELFNKTIKLLLSIIEFNMDEKVVNYMGTNIEFRFLIQRIKIIYQEFAESLGASPYESNLIWKVKDKVFDEKIKLGFNIFFFIKMIDDATHLYNEQIIDLEDLEKMAFSFLKENSGQLEVNFHGSIEKVYFMKHPACNYLDSDAQKRLMANVRRDSANEKITDFVTYAPKLFNLMDHTFTMTKRRKVRLVYLNYARDLALLVSFAINIYMIAYLNKDVRNTVSYDAISPDFELNFSILGWIHLSLGFLMLILQIILKNRLVRLENWRKYIGEFAKEVSRNKFKDDYESLLIKSVIEKDIMDVTADEKKLIITQRRKNDFYRNSFSSFIYATLSVEFFFMDSTMVYFMFYVLFSALAKFQGVWLFYCFSLFDIVVTYSNQEQIRSFAERHQGHNLQQVSADAHHAFGYYHHLHLRPLRLLLPD